MAADIKRINELARLAKERELTQEEQDERQQNSDNFRYKRKSLFIDLRCCLKNGNYNADYECCKQHRKR